MTIPIILFLSFKEVYVTVNGVNSNKCAILTSSTVPARVASGFFYMRIPFMDFR